MAGYRGKQGAKPKASTIVERSRRLGHESTLKGIPRPPAHLNETERAEWRRVARLLKEAGLLDSLDKTLLAAYCTVYARWVEAEDMVKKYGLVVRTPRKKKEGEDNKDNKDKDEPAWPMQSPYLPIANKCLHQMMQMLGEMGMTPAARSRIPKSEAREQRPQRKFKAHTVDPRDILELAN